MFEETKFAGKPPNVGLVYDLRKRALQGSDLASLLDLISERAAGDGFTFAVYLGLSFGVPIPLLKELGAKSFGIASNAELARRVMAAIAETRAVWEKRLQPGSDRNVPESGSSGELD